MVENYKLIYPNFEMEVYENFMKTAKLIWEEFTGSSNQASKVQVIKKDANTSTVVQPPKVAVGMCISNH